MVTPLVLDREPRQRATKIPITHPPYTSVHLYCSSLLTHHKPHLQHLARLQTSHDISQPEINQLTKVQVQGPDLVISPTDNANANATVLQLILGYHLIPRAPHRTASHQ